MSERVGGKESTQNEPADPSTHSKKKTESLSLEIPGDTFLKRYSILGKIGEGSYSEVLKCESRKDGTIVACKRLKHHYKSWSDVNRISEISTLRTLQKHANILQMLEIHYDEKLGTVSLVFELMDLNLYELIRDRKRLIPENRVRTIIFQLFMALRHLHKVGIFHRDVKPENILIKAETDQLKLGDLGSVRGINSRLPYTEYISTRWYRSPECLLTAGHYSTKMDLWAAGCVFYEVLTLRPLFPGSSEIDQMNRINSVLGPPPLKLLELFHKQSDMERDSYRGQTQLNRRKQIQKVLDGYSARYIMTHESKGSSTKSIKSLTRNQIEYHFAGREGRGLDRILSNHISREAKEIIKTCLAYDPEQRPPATRIIQLPYFRELRENHRRNPEKVPHGQIVSVCDEVEVETVPPVDLTTLGDHKVRYHRGHPIKSQPNADNSKVTSKNRQSEGILKKSSSSTTKTSDIINNNQKQPDANNNYIKDSNAFGDQHYSSSIMDADLDDGASYAASRSRSNMASNILGSGNGRAERRPIPAAVTTRAAPIPMPLPLGQSSEIRNKHNVFKELSPEREPETNPPSYPSRHTNSRRISMIPVATTEKNRDAGVRAADKNRDTTGMRTGHKDRESGIRTDIGMRTGAGDKNRDSSIRVGDKSQDVGMRVSEKVRDTGVRADIGMRVRDKNQDRDIGISAADKNRDTVMQVDLGMRATDKSRDMGMRGTEKLRDTGIQAGRYNSSLIRTNEQRKEFKESTRKFTERVKDEVFCSSDDDVVVSMRKKFDSLICERAKQLSDSLKKNLANNSVMKAEEVRRLYDSDEELFSPARIASRTNRSNNNVVDKSKKHARRELRARMAESLTMNCFPYYKWSLRERDLKQRVMLDKACGNSSSGDFAYTSQLNSTHETKPTYASAATSEKPSFHHAVSVLRPQRKIENDYKDRYHQEQLSPTRIYPFSREDQNRRYGRLFTPPGNAKPAYQSRKLGAVLHDRKLRYSHNLQAPVSNHGDYRGNRTLKDNIKHRRI